MTLHSNSEDKEVARLIVSEILGVPVDCWLKHRFRNKPPRYTLVLRDGTSIDMGTSDAWICSPRRFLAQLHQATRSGARRIGEDAWAWALNELGALVVEIDEEPKQPATIFSIDYLSASPSAKNAARMLLETVDVAPSEIFCHELTGDIVATFLFSLGSVAFVVWHKPGEVALVYVLAENNEGTYCVTLEKALDYFPTLICAASRY